MNQANQHDIYMSSYTEIEKEVLELANSIYFIDKHFNVYSTKIVNLIIRCSVELESIAKDLSRINNYEECEDHGKCFNCLEEHLKLSKKQIVITSQYFHFDKYKNSDFFPFDYKKESCDDYYKVYCSLKHDRIKNLSKATIYDLIRVLGALYILNIYFANKEIFLGNSPYETKMDQINISNIFNYKIAPCIDNIIMDSEKDINEDSCIYKIVRKESDYAMNIEYLDILDEKKNLKVIRVNDVFQNFVKKNINALIDEEIFFDIISANCAESRENLKSFFYRTNKIKHIISISFEKMKSSYWLKLNKE